MPDEHVEKLRKHLQAILAADNVNEGLELAGAAPALAMEGLEGMAADGRELELAVQGLEHFNADSEIFEAEASALEAIVLPRERPVVDILGGKFHEPPPPWRELALEPTRGKIFDAIPAVGRVEVPLHPTLPYAGTGFIVGEGLLMTNRHVAEVFTHGVGLKRLDFISGRQPGVDFKQEVIPSERIILDFESVVLVHPYWDCALVKVSGLPEDHPRLLLQGREPEGMEGRKVVVLGYPAQDSRNDLQLQNRIFRGIFQRKRMQPGRLQGYGRVRTYGNVVEALVHDSSTLGGNSGSVVLDVVSGRVLGLHFAGIYLEANFAVPAWELARDSRVRDAGVSFHQAPALGDPPGWEPLWSQADSETAVEDAKGAAPGSATPSPPREDVGLDWYEDLSDSALAEAIALDPEGTRRRLIAVLGEDEADEIMTEFSPEVQEGPEAPLDPNLPEILYLHGIMGSHLARNLGAGKRIWFRLGSFVAGNVAEKITLADDGMSDRTPGFRLAADGHLKSQYRRAANAWRRGGFLVHEFSYDWRKPVASAADQLHAFIEQRAAQNPGRRFALVAHSMGGLVSSIYAQRHPQWQDRIERAVFAGSPLGGSYAPIQAVLGVYPFFKTLAALSRNDGVADLARLAATLPGLLEILPNRDLFTGQPDFYTLLPWPDQPRPLLRWLGRSSGIKDEILASPLLRRTSGIVSREIGTVASVSLGPGGRMVAGRATAPGDGTVPTRAAAVPQLSRLYEAKGKKHASLFKIKEVIRAVGDILREGVTEALPEITVDELDFDEVLPEREALEVGDERLEGIQRRFDEGRLRAADLEWIFDPEGESPPQ